MTQLIRTFIRETLLLEEVYGAQAVVYHGTESDPQELISAILNDEFRPGEGSGSMYGEGLYTVYDPTFNPLDDEKVSPTTSGAYGNWVIKFKANLWGYIIFDPEVAKDVYKKPLTPVEQAEEFGYSTAAINALKEIDKIYYEFTSDAAKQVWKVLQNEVKGLVFTGRNDGRVVVIYDPTTVVPVAWKKIGEEWQKVDRTQVGFKQSVKKSALGSWEEGKYVDPEFKQFMSLFNVPINKRIVKGSLNISGAQLKSLPEGLKVRGGLNISHSNIRILPRGLEVGGTLNAIASKIDKISKEVKIGKGLFLSYSKIESIPEDIQIGGSLILSYTSIKSLPAGLTLGGLDVSTTGLSSLPENLTIDNSLNLSDTKIKSLPAGLTVRGSLNIEGTGIETLPDDLQVSGYIIGLHRSHHNNVPRHLKSKL